MAAPRRKAQRERDMERTADLYCRGWAQQRIAKELGVSPSTICQDLKTIRQRWRDSQISNIDEHIAKTLAQLDLAESEAWAAWEASKGPHLKTRTVDRSADDGGYTETATSEEELTGDPRYLSEIRGIIERRCKLLGLDAPARVEHTGDESGPIQFIIRPVGESEEGAD
jgi:hypothetical protein